MRGGRRRAGVARSVRPLAVVTAGLVALVVALAVVLSSRSSGSTTPNEVEAYQSSIKGAIQHWGKIEIYGMQPAMSDLRSGTGVPAGAIATEADAWRSGLLEIRSQLQAVAPPTALAGAAHGFQEALNDYLTAAQLVHQAAGVTGDARNHLLDSAVASAMRGDCAYDDASVALQSARRTAGLPVSPDYPDHPCAAASTSVG